jgi:hypothetical protein
MVTRRLTAALLAAAYVVVSQSSSAAAAVTAAASTDPATTLAQRYAPAVQLVNQPEKCGRAGEPYQPTNVDAVLGNPLVALRGPWEANNLVTVGPTAKDLSAGLSGYNLDYPGNALQPGCTYADWAQQLDKTSPPTMYAHIATQPDDPGRLALQYWFFYVFNDFNDKHEGDWEMLQLNFKASTATQALTAPPYEVGYSQHEGAERAKWGDPKLQLVDGTHPVVYPALGSHANYYSPALHLGRSGAQGVGCDNTLGPSREIRPDVVVIPQSSDQYLQLFPWLGYLGRWGERHPGFDNGPTGPNTKDRWSAPFTWTDTHWRDQGFTVPSGGRFGHQATGLFCSAVAFGSDVFTIAGADAGRLVLLLAVFVGILIWLGRRTRWRPAPPFRVARRRTWGTLVTAAFRLYVANPRLFLGIGLLFIPLGLLTAGLQYLIFSIGVLQPLVASAGQSNAFIAELVAGLGLALTLLGLTLVQAATTVAVIDLDSERPIGPWSAYRQAFHHIGSLLIGLVVAIVLVTVVSLTVVGVVVGIWLVVRWSLLAQAAVVADSPGLSSLRRSGQITRRHWWRSASFTLLVTGTGLLIGPLLGVLLLLLTGAPFQIVNLVSALVDVAVLPFVSIATTYLYFDLSVRARLQVGRSTSPTILPAEL